MPPPVYHYPVQSQQMTHSHQVYPLEPIPGPYQASNMSFGPKSYLIRHVPFRNEPNKQQASSAWPVQQVPPNFIPSTMISNQPPFKIQPAPMQRFPDEVQNEPNMIHR